VRAEELVAKVSRATAKRMVVTERTYATGTSPMALAAVVYYAGL
jgi:hypothetical protein